MLIYQCIYHFLVSVLVVDDGTAQRGSAEQPYRGKAAGSGGLGSAAKSPCSARTFSPGWHGKPGQFWLPPLLLDPFSFNPPFTCTPRCSFNLPFYFTTHQPLSNPLPDQSPNLYAHLPPPCSFTLPSFFQLPRPPSSSIKPLALFLRADQAEPLPAAPRLPAM